MQFQQNTNPGFRRLALNNIHNTIGSIDKVVNAATAFPALLRAY